MYANVIRNMSVIPKTQCLARSIKCLTSDGMFENFQIVRQDRTLERVVFPIHEICSFLTKETKQNVYNNTERDNQGSKVTEFFDQWPAMYQEMKWQRKLQDRPYLSACTQRLRLWGRLAFLFAVLVNIIIALYYPFETADTGLCASNPFMYTSSVISIIFLYSQWDEK
ncbi:hypothetical protein GCK32_018917 [Trichostrongylus colubriformis]|uniref:Uncharacterized protein n=1 Tax=Trichostrongylus colubriformis TaxID=6319 RepID=A0AAN8IHU8_TRICO